MPSIGETIRKLRKKKGWTQPELAVRVNKSPQVISNWERGYSSLDHEDISRLSKAFELPADEIIGENKINQLENGTAYNDSQKTIQLLEEEARRMGLSPGDPTFIKMLSNAFELLRTARGKDTE